MKKSDLRKERILEGLRKKHQKVIFIYGAPCNKSTGNGKLIYHMAKAFQSAGHEVVTIGLEYNRPMIWFDNIPILPGFHCEICGNAHKGNDENVQKIADYINIWPRRPDFFICVGDPFQMQQFGIGNLSFEKIKTKAIMYATYDSKGIFTNELLKEEGLKDYLDICDKIVSNSLHTQKQLKEWNKMESDMIYVTSDLNNYSPVSKEKKAELKKKHRFKSDDFVIFSSGRNIVRKRHNTLIDAAAKFICETKNTYLYLNIPVSIVGDKAFYPDTLNPLDFVKRVLKKKYGRDLNEEGRIIFIGRGGLGSEDITEQQNAEIYQMADVYAYATGAESFGVCPVESMACGVPVIIPDNTTGKEILGIDKIKNDKYFSKNSPTSGFQFGKGGLLVNAPTQIWVDWGLEQFLTTTENIYKAIKFLHNDPDLRNNLGKQGREYVEKTFNYGEFRRKWLEVLKTTEKKPKEKVEEEFKPVEIKGEKKDG